MCLYIYIYLFIDRKKTAERLGRRRDIAAVRVYTYILTICEKKNQITPRVICIILYCIQAGSVTSGRRRFTHREWG